MLGSVNPQAAQKAKNEYGKYSPDINGLKQAIADWGGEVMIDRAIEFVDKSPRVRAALRMANIDVKQIRQQLNETTSNSTMAVVTKTQNSYKDRLNKFR